MRITDHGQATLSLVTASRVHPFCNLQSRARTHAVLVIGVYELLGNQLPNSLSHPGPGYELTTLVVIGTSSYKSNYHTITTNTAFYLIINRSEPMANCDNIYLGRNLRCATVYLNILYLLNKTNWHRTCLFLIYNMC